MAKIHKLKVLESELQAVANAIAGYYNMAASANISISEEQTINLHSFLKKAKIAVDGNCPQIEIVGEHIILPG